MRVIAGHLKGRRIPFNNKRFGNARVTGDFVKEAVFASLGGDLTGRTFLDLFAGSGQMGIEAASRGARVVMAERDRRRHSFIRALLDEWQLQDVELHLLPFGRLLPLLLAQGRTFDAVYVDPPYESGKEETPLSISVLDRLSDAALLVPGGRVLVQHPRTSPHPDRVGRLDVVRSKRYGDSLVTTYRAPLVE